MPSMKSTRWIKWWIRSFPYRTITATLPSPTPKYLDTGCGFITITDADGNEYSAEDYFKDYLEANKDPKTAKFAGIILTGRAENFWPNCKMQTGFSASNIGQSVQIQPYHKPGIRESSERHKTLCFFPTI